MNYTMLSFWGWAWNVMTNDWNRQHTFDGSYTIVPGVIVNSYFGVTDKLDNSMCPLLIVHLKSGASVVWARTLDDAVEIIEKGLMAYDVWDRTDPIDVRDDVYRYTIREKLDKVRGTTLPTFLF